MGEDKSHRAAASQFFVAGELCRHGLVAVVTLGNCPNTDVLVSNKAGTRFVHVQVKTYRPGDKGVSVGKKAERDYGPGFFWVLAGIPHVGTTSEVEYYIVPSAVLSKLVSDSHQSWLKTPGAKGQAHNESSIRTVAIPPFQNKYADQCISDYKNRWDLIVDACRDDSGGDPSEEESS